MALAFALLLLWRMQAGLEDYREYLEVTAILEFPIWIAYLPILASLVLLAIASVMTLFEAAISAEKPPINS